MAQVAVVTRAGCWYQIRSDAAITLEATILVNMMRRILTREIESFERDISKYEQQSSDLSRSQQRCHQARNCVRRHGTPRFETTHRSENQSTRQCVTRSSTTARRAERGQTQTQCKSMQCMSTSARNGKAAKADHGQTKATGGKGGRGMSKEGCKGKEKDEKPVSKSEGECRWYQKKGHKKAECRKVKGDLASCTCDKNPVYFPNLVGRNLVRQHDRTGPENSLMVARRIRVVDSGCGLTSCPINYADDLPLLPRPTNLGCIGLRQVGYRLESGEPFVATRHVAHVTNLIIYSNTRGSAQVREGALAEVASRRHCSGQ